LTPLGRKRALAEIDHDGGLCRQGDLQGWVVLGGKAGVQSEAVIVAVERHGKTESSDKKSRPLLGKVST
jgi:hypothetical protein